jgi:hypothetical protein
LESVSSEKQSLISNYESKLELVHTELQEAKTGLSNANEKLKKANQVKDELTTKLQILKKDQEKLEQNINAKVSY